MEIITETEVHALPGGRVQLLGAVHSVTGAMTRVEWGGAALLIDCGVAQGDDAAAWQFPEAARDAQAVVLTHGHNDHCGSLPALLEGGWDGPIYGTRPTLEIADYVLSDGLGLHGASDDEIARFRTRFKASSKAIGYDQSFQVPGFAGQLAFREAGHILGSASVEITHAGSRLLCSGDLGRPDSPILRDYNLSWAAEPSLELVLMESTYGDGEHHMSHGDVETELERILSRAAQDGGHVVVPSFAIGRTQTLLYHLNSLVESGRAPDMLVAVDTPLGIKVTDLYQRHRGLFDRDSHDKLARGDDPLSFQDLYAVRRARDSQRLHEVSEPMLIIAGSGMCTGGRVVSHLLELLPHEQHCVLFVGYQARGTPGRAIQLAARSGGHVRLGGQDVPVRARIETLSGLSAHADRNELLRWLHALPAPRRIALHHGEPEAQAAFARFARGVS
ncbi:MAG TPA: MBL fold metallo-hydrolase [Polyangiales bacterium]|nr:MBL fold metallo-hydrolase [Polyangiales bacterium]